MFDDFVLLARGGLIVYHGIVSEIEMYFAGWVSKCLTVRILRTILLTS
jgi:hypothetical protein